MGQDLLNPGEMVGTFRVEKKVGHGGMGDVYRAVDTSLDRNVALKVMGEAFASDRSFVERFKTEAKAAASLVHPNIVNVFAVGETKGVPFIAMEYVDGESLQQKMVREKKLHPGAVLDYAIQASRGLEAAARRGVVHRDIKPGNLMIDKDGSVKVADFGLAKITTTDNSLTQTGVAVGTPLYMSPEQGRGDKLDLRADIYSLGATMYHAMCGKPPFEADTPIGVISKHALTPLQPLRVARPDIPPALSDLVGRMMAKAPAERPASYEALVRDLEGVRPSVPKAPRANPMTSVFQDLSEEEQKFARVAMQTGMTNEAQIRGAVQMQEKLKAAGKPARRLDEILVAAKVLTAEQREIIAQSARQGRWDDKDEEPASASTLEVTEVRKKVQAREAAKPGAAHPPCMVCHMELRPEQVQHVCAECGARQHGECYASFGGCGNESCKKSPKSMAAGDDEERGAAVVKLTLRDRLHGMMWPILGFAATVVIGLVIWKTTYKSAQSLYDEARAMDGSASKGRLTIFSHHESQLMVSESATGLAPEIAKRLDTQVHLYTKALEKDEAFHPARYERARCLLQLGRRDEALRDFEKVLESDASHKEAMLGAGMLHVTGGSETKAEAYLTKAAQSGMAEAWLHLGVLYQERLKSLDKAFAALRSYLQAKEGDGDAWARQSLVCLDLGKDTEAMSATDKAMQNSYAGPVAPYVRAAIGFKQGRFEEASSAAQVAAEKAPQGSDLKYRAHKIGGLALYKSGKLMPARSELTSARGINPADTEVLVALAETYVALGTWSEASVYYKEAFDKGTREPDHLFKAGIYAFRGDRGGSSPALFEELSRRKADYPELKLWLARAYLKAENVEASADAVKKAVEEKPDDPARKALTIWETRIQGKVDEAIVMADTLVVQHPDSVDILLQAAENHVKNRTPDRAVRFWQGAMDGGSTEAMFRLAEYYLNTNDRPRATDLFKKFIDKEPVGDRAVIARNALNSLINPNTNPGSTTTAQWEPLFRRTGDAIAKPMEAKNEYVDAVYLAYVSTIIAANVVGERYSDAAALLNDFSYAESIYNEGLTRYATLAPQALSDLRNTRIRDRFGTLAGLSERLLPAFAGVAKKINPKCETEVDNIVAGWAAAAPRDSFERAAAALDRILQMLRRALGESAAPVTDWIDAQLVVAENPVQQCTARVYGVCRMLAIASPKGSELLKALDEADALAPSGLAQLHAGWVKIYQLTVALRK
jgi:tetratricopeptide (TPR) repeat protein/predicted Ser/Thr protein kinase